MRSPATSVVSEACEANVVVRFKLGRGSHAYRSKMQPIQKSLALQGFFDF